MATSARANEVTLSVEFAGLCLYVIHPQRETVSILMPTCMPTPDGRVKGEHEDKTKGERHVPYLLIDLANLGQNVPPGVVGDGPQFGVVRRLRREEIFIEPEEPRSIQLDPDPLPLPDFGVYKGRIRLKESLLSDIPADALPELNVRTILRGGTLAATTVGGSGTSGGRPSQNPKWDEEPADWAGSIKWTRTIPGNSLTIRIRNWDTRQETPLTLTPVTRGGREVIELKIAILCENNPLEWKEFEPRFVKDDADFKWLFRLFEANDGGSVLRAIRRNEFPYPKLLPRRARPAGDPGCTGGQIGGPPF